MEVTPFVTEIVSENLTFHDFESSVNQLRIPQNDLPGFPNVK